MVDRPRLDQLLTLLAGYVRILRQLSTTPLDEFVDDPRNYGSAERFLQLAIETTLSIGHHIIADAGLRQPGTYAEVFSVLGKEGVLEAEFAESLQPMARMRNRLVHHYEDVARRTRLSAHRVPARRLRPVRRAGHRLRRPGLSGAAEAGAPVAHQLRQLGR